MKEKIGTILEHALGYTVVICLVILVLFATNTGVQFLLFKAREFGANGC